MKKILLYVICFFYCSPLIAVSKKDVTTSELYESLSSFSEVLHFIRSKYIHEISPQKLTSAAINGMLGILDPHSAYFDTDTFKELRISTIGEYSGIGLDLTIRDGKLLVISSLESSPSANAGILPDDHIVAIDGRRTANVHLLEIGNQLRGPIGTTVTLTIDRPGKNKRKKFQIRREHIKVSSIRSEILENNTLYIRILSFQSDTAKLVYDAITKAQSVNKNVPQSGIIIDVRDNSGGILDEAITLSDLFLENGTIIIAQNRLSQEEIKARKDPYDISAPIVILVNKGTASSAEIVTGALMDNKRAIVIGTMTFGKASIQSLIELEDKSGLKLTIGHYFTPSGSEIHGKGICPTILESIPKNQLSLALKYLQSPWEIKHTAICDTQG